MNSNVSRENIGEEMQASIQSINLTEKKFIMDLLSDKSNQMKDIFSNYKAAIRNESDIINILNSYV